MSCLAGGEGERDEDEEDEGLEELDADRLRLWRRCRSEEPWLSA